MTDSKFSKKEEDLVFTKECFYKKGVFEITINPSDQGRRSNIPAKGVLGNMHKIMKEQEEYARYELYLEISEPRYGNVHRGSEPRWHFHGFLEVTDPIEFISKGIPMFKKSSDYCINQLRLDEWSKYCDKQQPLISEYITRIDSQMLIKYPLTNTTRPMKVAPAGAPPHVLPSVRSQRGKKRGGERSHPSQEGAALQRAQI